MPDQGPGEKKKIMGVERQRRGGDTGREVWENKTQGDWEAQM